MLLVCPSTPAERQLLQQQFLTQNGFVSVPLKHSTILSSMIQSITFEVFHNNTPKIAGKIEEYVVRSFQMCHFLELYRQIMQSIKELEEKCMLYEKYASEMNEVIDEQNLLLDKVQSSSRTQNLDLKLQENLQVQEKQASLIEMFDIPILNLQTAKNFFEKEQVFSQATKNSISASIISSPEILEGGTRLANFFSTNSGIYKREDWQTQREQNKQDSKELDSFKKRCESVIEVNSSLQNLLVNEIAYDIKRQAYEHKPKEKDQKLVEEQYQKRMREMLVFSKIGQRKRR